MIDAGGARRNAESGAAFSDNTRRDRTALSGRSVAGSHHGPALALENRCHGLMGPARGLARFGRGGAGGVLGVRHSDGNRFAPPPRGSQRPVVRIAPCADQGEGAGDDSGAASQKDTGRSSPRSPCLSAAAPIDSRGKRPAAEWPSCSQARRCSAIAQKAAGFLRRPEGPASRFLQVERLAPARSVPGTNRPATPVAFVWSSQLSCQPLCAHRAHTRPVRATNCDSDRVGVTRQPRDIATGVRCRVSTHLQAYVSGSHRTAKPGARQTAACLALTLNATGRPGRVLSTHGASRNRVPAASGEKSQAEGVVVISPTR